jgi:hypothetical protein
MTGTSAIGERAIATIRKWVEERNADIPGHVRHAMRDEVDIEGRDATLFECRPPWDGDSSAQWTRAPIARLRYFKSRGTWRLYWCDSNDRFRTYPDVDPTSSVKKLLNEVEADPFCLFWG